MLIIKHQPVPASACRDCGRRSGDWSVLAQRPVVIWRATVPGLGEQLLCSECCETRERLLLQHQQHQARPQFLF